MKGYILGQITGIKAEAGNIVISSCLNIVREDTGERVALPDVKISSKQMLFPQGSLNMQSNGDMPVHKTLVPALELWQDIFLHGEIMGDTLCVDDAPDALLFLPKDRIPFMLPPKEAFRKAFLSMHICSVKQTYKDILDTMEVHSYGEKDWSLDDIRACTEKINPEQMVDFLHSVAQDIHGEAVFEFMEEIEDEKRGPSPA